MNVWESAQIRYTPGIVAWRMYTSSSILLYAPFRASVTRTWMALSIGFLILWRAFSPWYNSQSSCVGVIDFSINLMGNPVVARTNISASRRFGIGILSSRSTSMPSWIKTPTRRPFCVKWSTTASSISRSDISQIRLTNVPSLFFLVLSFTMSSYVILCSAIIVNRVLVATISSRKPSNVLDRLAEGCALVSPPYRAWMNHVFSCSSDSGSSNSARTFANTPRRSFTYS